MGGRELPPSYFMELAENQNQEPSDGGAERGATFSSSSSSLHFLALLVSTLELQLNQSQKPINPQLPSIFRNVDAKDRSAPELGSNGPVNMQEMKQNIRYAGVTDRRSQFRNIVQMCPPTGCVCVCFKSSLLLKVCVCVCFKSSLLPKQYLPLFRLISW